MVQLSNDCFAFGGKLMTIDEALALIATRVQPVAGEERLPLFDCDNRILVSPLRAPVPSPTAAAATRWAPLAPLWRSGGARRGGE